MTEQSTEDFQGSKTVLNDTVGMDTYIIHFSKSIEYAIHRIQNPNTHIYCIYMYDINYTL